MAKTKTKDAYKEEKRRTSGDAALTEIQRQRTVLGQQYQAAINQASAESDFQRLSALYQEAVRVEEALTQQEQYYTNLFLKYGQSLVGQLGGTVRG